MKYYTLSQVLHVNLIVLRNRCNEHFRVPFLLGKTQPHVLVFDIFQLIGCASRSFDAGGLVTGKPAPSVSGSSRFRRMDT